MAVALIVAAGRGERLGHDRPKALVPLGGRPLLEWCVTALDAVEAVTRIIVALPADHLDAAPAGTIPVAGGRVRSESVLRALRAAPEEDPVLVHDAARPFAAPSLFAAGLEELETSGADAVIAAAPVTDTVKEVGPDGRSVALTLARSRLWAVQTPQVFRRAALEGALGEASEADLAAATDDAWLVERRGGRVRILPSDASNMKVTTAFDLRVAELMLRERADARIQSIGSVAAPRTRDTA